jgi:hypothetical protein
MGDLDSEAVDKTVVVHVLLDWRLSELRFCVRESDYTKTGASSRSNLATVLGTCCGECMQLSKGKCARQ